MRLRHLILPLLAVPLLSACVNDGATYEIDNTREHVLSLIREQPYFWADFVRGFQSAPLGPGRSIRWLLTAPKSLVTTPMAPDWCAISR